jgi:hypothetical protein
VVRVLCRLDRARRGVLGGDPQPLQHLRPLGRLLAVEKLEDRDRRFVQRSGHRIGVGLVRGEHDVGARGGQEAGGDERGFGGLRLRTG